MRIRRKIDRVSKVKDAKLFIIATEDTKCTVKYFNDFKEYFENSKIQIEIIERDETASSPKYVLKSIDNFKKRHGYIKNYDEFHLVIDIDDWKERELSEVMRECTQKEYFTNVSNPRIELWFLLHHLDIAGLSVAEKKQILTADAYASGSIEFRLKELVGFPAKNKKRRIKTDDYLPLTSKALINAKKLYSSSRDRWPQTLGTDIYKLIEKLLP
jgi:hypothetical protein